MELGDLLGADVRVMDQVLSDPQYEAVLIELYGEEELKALRALKTSSNDYHKRRGNDVM